MTRAHQLRAVPGRAFLPNLISVALLFCPLAGCSGEAPEQSPSPDCGNCPKPTFGEFGASGVAAIDGTIEAANLLDQSVTRSEQDFTSSLAEVEAIWGLDEAGSLAARVGAVVAAMAADFGPESASGARLSVQVTAAECRLGLQVAARAQVACEAEAGCTANLGTAADGASSGCAASADCEAQAEAQSNASLECSPPALQLTAIFTAEVSSARRAELLGKIAILRVHGAGMLRSFAQYQALISGRVGGELVFEPPPLEVVIDSLELVIEASVEGELFADLPPGRLPCVVPVLSSSAALLGEIASEATASLEAQASFAKALSAGFSGS